MPAWANFRERPQQLLLRKILFQVHVWAGISVGLYLVAMSLTGSVLVFAEELERFLRPDLYGESTPQPTAAISTFLQGARAAYPDRQVTALYLPSHERNTVRVYLRKGEEILYAYLDPVTARVVGDTRPSTSLVRWMQDLHFNLFSGRSGRAVNGVGGALLCTLCVTGVFIWWPGVRRWLSALKLRRGVSLQRFVWDFHSAAGFWSVALLGMWGLTGFYFGFPTAVSAFVHRWSALSSVQAPDSRAPVGNAKVDLERMIAEARDRSPDGELFGVQFPATHTAPYIVFMARAPQRDKQHSDYLYFDRYSGEYLRTWRRGMNVSLGDAVISWMVPLHFGTFGGWPVKVLWSVFGLAPSLLFLTGFLMWWRRVVRRRVDSALARARETRERRNEGHTSATRSI